jgi:hypothetical protein
MVIYRVGQNRIYTPYMTLCLVISLPKVPYIHCNYMALANLSYLRITHGANVLPTTATCCIMTSSRGFHILDQCAHDLPSRKSPFDRHLPCERLDFPRQQLAVHAQCAVLARTVNIHRIFGDSPVQNTLNTLYVYGSDQPYQCRPTLSMCNKTRLHALQCRWTRMWRRPSLSFPPRISCALLVGEYEF